jgi:hypothetical protein
MSDWKEAKDLYLSFERTRDEMGIHGVINHYDKYRRYSFWVFFALAAWFAVTWSPLAIVMLALLHVHALLNQIWWKILKMEAQQCNAHNVETNTSDEQTGVYQSSETRERASSDKRSEASHSLKPLDTTAASAGGGRKHER